MSEQNWTPGPWSIEPAWDERCCGSVAIINRDHPRDDWDVCEVHSTEANAHLIRTAPELYEALVAARAELAGLPRSLGYDIDSLPMIDAVLKKARGAQ